MNLLHLDFPVSMLVPAWILTALGLAWAVRRAHWEHLAACSLTRVWHASIIAVVLLWSLKGSLRDGFSFHLLGMAALSLMLRPPLALISAALAIFVLVIIERAALANLAPVWLTLAAVPIAVSRATLWLVERHLPANFFVFVFVAAFLGTALSLAAAMAAALITWSWAANLELARSGRATSRSSCN
jgi:Predicted membrane protein